MKKFNFRFINKLIDKKGEMLIETIISVMLFTILIVGITTIITSATNGIRATQREADNVQLTTSTILTNPDSVSQDVDITVTLEVSDSIIPNVVTVEHPGKIISEEDMIYFYPAP